MNKLAEKLGMDPVEFRLLNALKQGETMAVGTPAPNPISISECIESARDKFEWVNKHNKKQVKQKKSVLRRGYGFAAGFKNVGFSFGTRKLLAKLNSRQSGIEHVIVHHAGANRPGTHSVQQMAAETWAYH
jgi:CO/xanthine dehydrogenase Mo-binding subunit